MPRPDLLPLLAELAPEEIRRELPGRRDVCVLATRVGYDVLSYFGVESAPVVVRALAFNPPAVAWVNERGPNVSDEQLEEYNATGAWVVAIDEEDHEIPGRFPGHLVLRVPSERALVDLSIDQFARPERGIIMPKSAIFDAPDDFFSDDGAATYGLEGGGRLAYFYRQRGTKDFRSGADWKRKNPISGRVIRRLRATPGIPESDEGRENDGR